MATHLFPIPESVHRRSIEGQVLLREDLPTTFFPKGILATYQGNYVLIKVTGLPRFFKDYWTVTLV